MSPSNHQFGVPIYIIPGYVSVVITRSCMAIALCVMRETNVSLLAEIRASTKYHLYVCLLVLQRNTQLQYSYKVFYKLYDDTGRRISSFPHYFLQDFFFFIKKCQRTEAVSFFYKIVSLSISVPCLFFIIRGKVSIAATLRFPHITLVGELLRSNTFRS